MKKWIGLAVAVLVAVLTVFALVTFRSGHVIRAEFMTNHADDFDFRQPPCSPAPLPRTSPGELLVGYLGTSGVYLEHRGVAVLGAPFFSNYSQLRVAFGSVAPDRQAIRAGLADLPGDRVRAVLVGHAHYDHIADLPAILGEHVPAADVLVNPSGTHMLRGCDGVGDRFVDLDGAAGEWIRPTDGEGRELPLRIRAIPATHAPHTRFYRFAPGKVTEPWDCMTDRPLRSLKQGQVYAFLIDFLDDDERIAFRVHYQDAASGRPMGFPSTSLVAERAVDLAVVCMPSSWMVEGYPEGLIGHTRARHVLITHYEDFFRPQSDAVRFVPSLTDARADEFMHRVRDAMRGNETLAPVSEVCGPSTDGWSMPLPGEWLRFASADQ